MKTALVGILMVLVGLQAQAQPPQQPAPLNADQCRCSIEVIVKRTLTGEPIRDVELQLRARNALLVRETGVPVPAYRDGPLSVKTDGSGRAEFRDLAEGLYTVMAQAKGEFYFAGIRSSFEETSVYVGPREKRRQQVSFTMMTGGRISGRILHSNGQPVRTTIGAYRVEYADGRRSLVASSTGADTNELGEYRLTRLPAGEYYIRTVSPSPQQNQTYYPGVLGPTSALPVAIQEGQELPGIDFNIPAQMGVTVSGTIINTFPGGDIQSDGKLLRAISSLYLVPRNTGFYLDFPQAIPNTAKGNSNTSNGTEFPFEIHDVPPGSYDFYPLFVDTATDTRVNRYISPTRIEVGTEDIKNVAAVLRKGTNLTVRVTRDGPNSPLPASRVETSIGVSLIPKDGLPSEFPTGRNATRVNVQINSSALFRELMDGRYTVQVSELRTTDYVSDIRQGTKSVFDDGFFTYSGDTPDPLELIVRTGSGTIQGRIDSNARARGTSGVTITLVPDPPRRQNLLLYKTAIIYSDPNGNDRFFFVGLAPGTYRVFAWDNLPRGAEYSPEFVSRYESRGISVTISAGQTLGNLEIPVIPVQ